MVLQKDNQTFGHRCKSSLRNRTDSFVRQFSRVLGARHLQAPVERTDRMRIDEMEFTKDITVKDMDVITMASKE